MGMDRAIPVWVWSIPLLLVLLTPITASVDDNVKQSLLGFMQRLSPGVVRRPEDNWGWNSTSDPCVSGWKGVSCDSTSTFVQKIVLEGLNFTGGFDAGSLCVVPSLGVISLKGNNLTGGIPETISNCKRLTHLYLARNRLWGRLPDGVSKLGNLKRLDVSNNEFSGNLPKLNQISGLITFFAQNNRLSGPLPAFELSNFQQFNVSNNNFTGPIPDARGLFGAESFRDNPGLCGIPILIPCPSPPSLLPQRQHQSKKRSVSRFAAYLGYLALGLVILAFVIYKIARKLRPAKEKISATERKESVEDTTTGSAVPNAYSSIYKNSENRSEFSMTSAETGTVSLVMLTDPIEKDLKFEDLLRAPAELLGRGKHGTLYKVTLSNGLKLVVKRIKDWGISPEEFDRRMKKVDKAKHPNVLPPIAFYCSRQEKLIVYRYHRNGSLFSLLHERQGGEVINWASRLTIVAAISNALAFMHSKLRDDGIPHGNIKSTNILFDEEAEPCLSEYGLIPVDHILDKTRPSETSEDYSDTSVAHARFEDDVYGFGVVLLELLTGKTVQNNGHDLAKWVHSVVKQEWTGEVFDRALLSEGASEERMVKVLQVALRCLSDNPGERPSMSRAAEIINAVKEEEETSASLETPTMSLN